MSLKNISAGTIARTIILALALVNQILSATGHAVLPIEDATVENLVSSVFTVAAAGVAWWRNNSFTGNAIKADNVLKEIKSGNSVTVTDPTTERRENSI